MGKRPLTEETRDLIRRDWRRMKHDKETILTITQLHAVTKQEVIDALGDLYDPNEKLPPHTDPALAGVNRNYPTDRKRRRGGMTAEDLAVLEKVAAGEMSQKEAADELYIAPQTVSKWLKQYKEERAAQAEAPADPAGATCMNPEKMHEPDRAEESFPAPETAPAGPHIESTVDNIYTYIVELEGAFLELSRYGLISEQAADACLQGIRLKAEGFIAGLRWRGISDAGQGQTPE